MNVAFCHVECEMSERLKSAYHFMISEKMASIAVYQSVHWEWHSQGLYTTVTTVLIDLITMQL